MKVVEAVGSKTASRKRVATDDQVRPSHKRQKIQKAGTDKKDEPKQERVKWPADDEVFRFMGLPGGTCRSRLR